MPDWATVLFSLLGGGTLGAVGKSLFDWMTHRDALGFGREDRLWKEIHTLQDEVRVLRAAVDRCEDDRDELRAQNGKQQGEINELKRAIKP